MTGVAERLAVRTLQSCMDYHAETGAVFAAVHTSVDSTGEVITLIGEHDQVAERATILTGWRVTIDIRRVLEDGYIGGSDE